MLKLLEKIKASRRLQIMLTLLVVFVAFQVYHLFSTYHAQQKMKQDTLHYLEEEKAYYIKDEVAEIKVYLSSVKERTYTSAVVFTDEIDVIYFYA